jgi:hypothetical protein
MTQKAAKNQLMDNELGVEWRLPSRSDDSLNLDLDRTQVIEAIRANGEAINQKISETKIESKLNVPVSNATLNVKVD